MKKRNLVVPLEVVHAEVHGDLTIKVLKSGDRYIVELWDVGYCTNTIAPFFSLEEAIETARTELPTAETLKVLRRSIRRTSV